MRMHRKSRPAYGQTTRSMQFEWLEKRDLMAQGNGVFVGYGSLTYSVAPDGARVGSNISALQSTFNQVASRSQWELAIAKAFQTWSAFANVNFGQVPDNGAASGIFGPTRGDERFGDIRITGFPFAADLLAEAVSENSRSVGTWSGDVFFNTAANWTSVEQIEAAAIHEIGHILGLDHSDDPNSPMYSHTNNTVRQLTASDIASLRKLHGARQPDANEGKSGNDAIGLASSIRGNDEDLATDRAFNGSQVWIQFGDLSTATDRDIYEVRTAVGYSGPIAVELRTSGLSLARLSAVITDRAGNVLAHADLSDNFGGSAALVLDRTVSDGKYYFQVSGGADAFWNIGDYSITVATPSRLQSDRHTIDAWTNDAHRWYYDSNRIRNGFSWHSDIDALGGPVLNDNHSDDIQSKAVFIPLVLDTELRVRYSIVGTINDLTDIDYYRVIAPKNINGRSELTVDVESLAVDGVFPKVTLFDRAGNVLNSETRVRGFGQTQLVVTGIAAEQEVAIRLESDARNRRFAIGSYSLNATFSAPSLAPDVLLSGTVQPGVDTVEREWYVAEPQLFGLSLQSIVPNSEATQVWATIFDSQRRMITGLVTTPNELRSAPGLFLDAGAYFIQVVATSNALIASEVGFRFMAETPSTPIGVLLGGTTVRPTYLCPGSTIEYCYPNSTAPTTNSQQVGPTPTVPLPPPPRSQPATLANDFFWSNGFMPTNPVNPLDSNGDQRVDPLDVLFLINAINSQGIGAVPTPPQLVGYLDTNANGRLEPLDVLAVVNFLNT